VVDLSVSNEAITNRSFGSDPDTVVEKALAFIEGTQDSGILATIKHFPGHGLVQGDTHARLVYIDGDMQELGIYPPLIERGVLSVMVGHIAVRNNEGFDTDGLPASCSGVIVGRLLRDSLGFDGIIVTDAMNMGALSDFGNAPLLAALAGCDMILMPPDALKLRQAILDAMQGSPDFSEQVQASVKRIIRMKYCLGLLKAGREP
jgi:beta-N-acetylhexosaminidase